MKSGQEISVAHLETIRKRRMRRIRRQRAIEVGKPVDVSLKAMALNPTQKRVLSDLHVQPHVDQKYQIMTPKRVSVMAALGLHLIAVLLGSYYVVKPARLDAEAKSGEIVDFILICGLGGANSPPFRFSRVTEMPNPYPLGLGCPTPSY